MGNLRKRAIDVAVKAVVNAVEFIRKIKPNDKVVVVNDDDCDGVCSGTILNMILRDFCKNKPVQISTEWNMTLTKKLVKNILSCRPKYVIIIDVPDINAKFLEELSKKARILVIDHHSVSRYKNVVYSNPRLFDADVYLPATYLAYKISEKLRVKNKKIMWITAVGVLGDHGVESCEDFFVNLKKEFPDLIGDSELTSENLRQNSKLGLLAKIVDAGRVVKADVGAAYVAKVLLQVKDYEVILKKKTAETKKLVGWYDVVEKEFEELVGEFKEKSVPVGKTLFFEFKSRLKIKSSLATAVGGFYDDKVIVIAQNEGKYYTLSMRRGKNSTMNLDRLMRTAIKGIPDSFGGGHPEASGGRIPAKYMGVFKKNLA